MNYFIKNRETSSKYDSRVKKLFMKTTVKRLLWNRLGKGKGRKGEGNVPLFPSPGREGNGNSERPRGREGMKIDWLGMKGKDFLELASNIFKTVF
jgi:hypothetical protein